MVEKISVGRFSTPGSTGNNNWVTTDLDGETPVACIIIGNFADTDGIVEAGMMWGMGFCDDTNEGSITAGHGDGDSPVDGHRGTHNTQVIANGDTRATGDVDAAFVSFIENGVTLNWSDLPATSQLYTVIFFAGSGVSAYMETITPGAVSTTTSVTGAGFQADIVFLSTATRTGTSTSGSYQNAFGICTPGNTDVCLAVHDLAGGAASVGVSTVRSDRCIGWTSTTGGGSWRSGLTSSVNANGVDLNVVDLDMNVDVHCLLLKFDTIKVSVGSFDSPTSTGNNTLTDPNFRPQAVIFGLTNETAVDTINTTTSCAWGISAFTGDSEFCNSWADQDAANPSNTQCISDNTAVRFSDYDGSNLHTASFVEMGAQGPTLNYSAANGTVRKWFYAAFEKAGSVILRRRREMVGVF
jgi:hypothetical protein